MDSADLEQIANTLQETLYYWSEAKDSQSEAPFPKTLFALNKEWYTPLAFIPITWQTETFL